MKKVVLFRDMRAEGWRSMDRYADMLTNEFSSRLFSRDNFKFSIFSTEPPLKSSTIKIFWRRFIYPLLAAKNQGNVNHVLDHSYAHLLNFLDARKTVVTCHDLIPLQYEKNEDVLTEFRTTVGNLSKAAFIIADSLATKKDLVEKLSIPAEKIKVIYLGVEPIFRPGKDMACRIRNKYSLPQGKIIMIHGNTLAYKNIEGVLKAFREVAAVDRTSILVRAGTEPLTSYQAKLLHDLTVSNRFFEIINPSDEDLISLYNCADVFLSPSFKEGFGLTVLQSLACGTPVVVSKGTSLEEIAGEVGVYVDPHDVNEIARAALSVLNKESTMAGNREALIKRASEFTWEKTARETMEVYNHVLEGGGAL